MGDTPGAVAGIGGAQINGNSPHGEAYKNNNKRD